MTQTNPAQNDIVLRLQNITKRFGALTANNDISFDLRRGEVLALLGENGAGKTTLMNILFGHYTADEGSIDLFGAPLPPGQPSIALASGLGMVHQHFTLAENLSVLDNITLGTRPLISLSSNQRTARKKLAILSEDYGLAVDPDAKISALSVGEKQRVEILKALYRDAKILILDEPTAVLTPQEAEALFATLSKATERGLSVIFISHKLHEVLAISDRIAVLRHGVLVGQEATADMDEAQIIQMMVGAEVTLPSPPKATPGAPLLALDRVTTRAAANQTGLQNANLILRAGQITGLAGVSGNGQSALADLISGLIAPESGDLTFSESKPDHWSPRTALAAGIGRIPEDRHKTGTVADFSLTENTILETYREAPLSKRGWMNWRAARKTTEEIIERYDVRCPGPSTAIRQLSGGNMQKLILGRVLEATPKIILANQPVRGLDIGAVTYVQNRLIQARDAGAAILLISEDLDEILSLSDVIHVMSKGRLSPEFERGTMNKSQLGRWMAGHGFGEQNAA